MIILVPIYALEHSKGHGLKFVRHSVRSFVININQYVSTNPIMNQIFLHNYISNIVKTTNTHIIESHTNTHTHNQTPGATSYLIKKGPQIFPVPFRARYHLHSHHQII